MPWVYGAAIRWAGTVYAVLPGRACIRCLFGNARAEETCETAGIVNAASAATASFQSGEALKILLGKEPGERMLRLNLSDNSFLKIRVPKDSACPACNGRYEYLSGKKAERASRLCGKDMYQVMPGKAMRKAEFASLKKRLLALEGAIDYGQCIRIKSGRAEMSIFEDGRALIRARDEKRAKSLYSGFVGD